MLSFFKRYLTLILAIVLVDYFSVSSQTPVITDPEVSLIQGGFQFVEGPVWIDGIGLLFSDIPANTVYRWTDSSGTAVFQNPSGNSNGLACNHENLLLLAQHGPRQIARLESDNSIIPLATHYNGKHLNSPNDLVIHSDGSVFFTDPPYGLNDQGGTPELTYNGIFRLSPGGEVQLLDSTLYRPNGITFSPDEKRLYVSDSETRRIYRWDVIDDSTIANKQEFAFMQPAGYADGMKVDSAGCLYVAGPIGIWIFDTNGVTIDTIPVPGQTTNCAWGGEDRSILYVTSGSALYSVRNKEENPDGLGHNQFMDNIRFDAVYPNPFYEFVQVPFCLNSDCNVKLDVYNSTGERVETLFNQYLGRGTYIAVWNAQMFRSGYYIIIAETDYNLTYSCILNKI